jgi:apolipoprotein N-acyltransferase
MKFLERLGAWVRGLAGWRAGLLAFAAGALSAVSFAPPEIFPLLLLGLAVLALLLDGAMERHVARGPRFRAGFGLGWAFGFGQFLVGLHWIGYAFMVDPAAHLWQMPFAILVLTAGLALFTGAAAALASLFWRPGPARLLLLAVCYAVLEWLRGHIFTGFPWNLAAYGWGASLAVLQSTAIFGAYGLTFLTLLFGLSLAELTYRRWTLPLVMLALFAGFWGYGAWRLGEPTRFVPDVSLRVVQPDIPQREKDKRAFADRNWRRLLDLSHKPGGPKITIWPEAAPPPLLLQRSAAALEQVADLTRNGRILMTGAVRAEAGIDGTRFFNSFLVFGPGPRLDAVYDKFHLVPFGEYVPFVGFFHRIGVTKLTPGQVNFSTGDGPHVYDLAGVPALSPLICYEIIFPAAVTDHLHRPQWFVNATDDSWFGPWAGPHQHLVIARVRAIEEGVPVVRAANTGISAIIDANGRLLGQLKLDEMGVLDGKLPAANTPSTYARFGDWGFLLLLLAGCVIAWFIGRK